MITLDQRATCMRALDALAFSAHTNLLACRTTKTKAYWAEEIQQVTEAKVALNKVFEPIRQKEGL